MCSRRAWLAASLSVVLSAHVSAAQTVPEYTKRVDSLTTVWRAALAAKVRDDSLRVRQLPADTVRVGNLVVLTDSAHAALSRETGALVSPALDAAYGSWAARMKTHVLVVRRPAQRPTGTDSAIVQSGLVQKDGHVLMGVSAFATTEGLSTIWRRQAEEFLFQDFEPSFRDWLGPPIPSEPTTVRSLTQGRVDLVLSRSRVAHECALGAPGSCSKALGLVPVEDPAFGLFDEPQRVDMIKWYSFVLRRRDPSKYTRCVSDGNRAACDSLVRSIPTNAVPTPVSGAVRLNFVRYALAIGGDGAFDRLALTNGTPGDRIAAAARLPIDSVVSRWQSNLMSSPSSSTSIDPLTAISSLFWAGLCGTLALRSSRWR